MAIKRTQNFSGWMIGFAAVVIFVGRCHWEESRNEVRLLPGGKAIFYRAGMFSRDRLDLRSNGGRWQVFENGSNIGEDFNVPFESPYNDYVTLRLETGGKAFLLDKKTMTRQELRVVNGEWSYDAADHWQSIFDLDAATAREPFASPRTTEMASVGSNPASVVAEP